ncbi:MAG: hypothetical protein LBR80_02065 [Deltaproteobacteria bacterium]|nr:hypothetical protein [Deltaproteobacteria bacterium]
MDTRDSSDRASGSPFRKAACRRSCRPAQTGAECGPGLGAMGQLPGGTPTGPFPWLMSPGPRVRSPGFGKLWRKEEPAGAGLHAWVRRAAIRDRAFRPTLVQVPSTSGSGASSGGTVRAGARMVSALADAATGRRYAEAVLPVVSGASGA